MLETMYEAHGVGLAAPQVGLGLRLFVAAEYDDEQEGKLYLDKLPPSVKAKHRAYLADLQRQAKSHLKSLRAP